MFAFNLIYLISHFHSFSADRRGAELSFKIHFQICMVKTRMYTTSHVGEKLQISYEDQGAGIRCCTICLIGLPPGRSSGTPSATCLASKGTSTSPFCSSLCCGGTATTRATSCPTSTSRRSQASLRSSWPEGGPASRRSTANRSRTSTQSAGGHARVTARVPQRTCASRPGTACNHDEPGTPRVTAWDSVLLAHGLPPARNFTATVCLT